MTLRRVVLIAGMSLVLCLFSFWINAESSLPVLKIDGRKPLAISAYIQGRSYPLTLPPEFLKDAEDLYGEVYIKDLNGDGIGEVIFPLEGGGVNNCSKVLHYGVVDNSLSELVFGVGSLCGFKVGQDYVISSYRDGSVWKEYVYRIRGGLAEVEVIDSCVGCGEIKREVHNSDGSVTRFLVSDNIDFRLRVPLMTSVASSKAIVFLSPENSRKTSKYLVGGDKITLLDFFKDADGKDWVEFRYVGIIVTEGWVKCTDLEYCDGS
jgi:hypothetical protein